VSVDELVGQVERARKDYEALVAKGLKLDLTRGKPSPKQLDAANGVLELSGEPVAADGTDLRNYGGLQGLPEVRAIFAEDLQVPVQPPRRGGPGQEQDLRRAAHGRACRSARSSRGSAVSMSRA